MHYSDTAYRSDSVPDMPPTPERNSGFWAQMGLRAGRKLTTNDDEALPTDLALRWQPSEFREEELTSSLEPASAQTFFTHERLITERPPAWFRLIVFLEMSARWGIGPMIVISFFVDIYIYFSGVLPEAMNHNFLSFKTFQLTFFLLA